MGDTACLCDMSTDEQMSFDTALSEGIYAHFKKTGRAKEKSEKLQISRFTQGKVREQVRGSENEDEMHRKVVLHCDSATRNAHQQPSLAVITHKCFCLFLLSS